MGIERTHKRKPVEALSDTPTSLRPRLKGPPTVEANIPLPRRHGLRIDFRQGLEIKGRLPEFSAGSDPRTQATPIAIFQA
jgi:hypothetical protein